MDENSEIKLSISAMIPYMLRIKICESDDTWISMTSEFGPVITHPMPATILFSFHAASALRDMIPGFGILLRFCAGCRIWVLISACCALSHSAASLTAIEMQSASEKDLFWKSIWFLAVHKVQQRHGNRGLLLTPVGGRGDSFYPFLKASSEHPSPLMTNCSIRGA